MTWSINVLIFFFFLLPGRVLIWQNIVSGSRAKNEAKRNVYQSNDERVFGLL